MKQQNTSQAQEQGILKEVLIQQEIKKIARELWELYCDLKVSEINKLKEKIQELNKCLEN